MLEKLFNVVVALTGLCVILVGIFYWGPKLEPQVYPVLTNVALTYTHPLRIDELIVASGYVRKDRECRRLSIQAHLGDRHDGVVDYIKLKTITMASQDVAKGMERWTLLLAVPKHYVDGDNIIKLTATYRCHPLWETVQVVRDSLASEFVDSPK